MLCLSDVQGNLDALRAVLATAERRSFQKLIVAGDIVFPGSSPLETWRRLTAAGAVLIQGLGDKALAMLEPGNITAVTAHERERLAQFKRTHDELGELILERLRRLPNEVRIPLEDGRELLVCHGSPVDPSEAMTFDMSDEEINALIGDDPADVIVCGMSHVPFDRMIGEVRVINVGSVGDAPDGRASLALPPQVAHATWIESTAAGVTVDQVTVPLTPSSVRPEAGPSATPVIEK